MKTLHDPEGARTLHGDIARLVRAEPEGDVIDACDG
jgi:hypothetical protein